MGLHCVVSAIIKWKGEDLAISQIALKKCVKVELIKE